MGDCYNAMARAHLLVTSVEKPVGWLWAAAPATELLHFGHALLAGMSMH